jgi:hypothetical protein
MTETRFVCRFSCGAASAVAAKLTLNSYPKNDVLIVNAYIKEEDSDNRRFLDDCEKWFGWPVLVLRDEKYGASTHEVWKRRRFMKNRFTAPCSQHLKREVLASIRKKGDITIIGYTVEENDRAQRLSELFPDERFEFTLINRCLTKSDCLAIIERAGIPLPRMYRLGYHNANCIGCVKGGEGYWNKIRRDFPEQFYQIAAIQKEIGPGANLFRNRKTGERYSLLELPLDAGRYQDEPEIQCSFLCAQAEEEIATA